MNRETRLHVGPSLSYYRCVQRYISRTKVVVDSNTIKFFLPSIPFPTIKMKDFLQQVALGIVSILSKLSPTIIPNLNVGNKINNTLLEIAKILNRSDKILNL